MALAAVKTFINAEPLYASDLNALNTNILNNGFSLISPLTGNLNVNTLALTNISSLRLTDTAAAPATSGYFQRNQVQLQWFDGSRVQTLREQLDGMMFTVPTATTGTVEEALWTTASGVPRDVYNRTGWAMCLRVHWLTAANANQKVLKLRIDDGTPQTTTIFDTTANNAHIESTVWIWSTGSSLQRWQFMSVAATAGGVGIMSTPATVDTTLSQTATPWSISLRGLTPTATGDMTLLASTLSLEA